MAERILSYADIDDIWREYGTIFSAQGFARAVEAAVLAKCVKFTNGNYAIFRDGCEARVTEREARKRERVAWDTSQAFMWGRSLAFKDMAVSGAASHKERDRRYPLPTVTRPRTVTLSDGIRVCKNDVPNVAEWKYYRANSLLDGTLASPFSLAKTPADARLLADLVEHPTEEVSE